MTRRGVGVGGAGRPSQGEGGRDTPHFLPPLPRVGPGPRDREAAPGSQRSRDRAPGAGFRVCFYLAVGGAARTQRFSLCRAVPAQGTPRGDGRAGEPQRRGHPDRRDPAGPTGRDSGAETPNQQRQRAIRRRGPDPHTQAVAGRAEVSAPGTQPQGPPARPALPRGPAGWSLGRAS